MLMVDSRDTMRINRPIGTKKNRSLQQVWRGGESGVKWAHFRERLVPRGVRQPASGAVHHRADRSGAEHPVRKLRAVSGSCV